MSRGVCSGAEKMMISTISQKQKKAGGVDQGFVDFCRSAACCAKKKGGSLPSAVSLTTATLPQ